MSLRILQGSVGPGLCSRPDSCASLTISPMLEERSQPSPTFCLMTLRYASGAKSVPRFRRSWTVFARRASLLPNVELMRFDGVNLAKRVQELMFAESSILNELDGVIGNGRAVASLRRRNFSTFAGVFIARPESAALHAVPLFCVSAGFDSLSARRAPRAFSFEPRCARAFSNWRFQ